MVARRAPHTQAELTRYLKALSAAGMQPGEVTIGADGTLTIRTANAPAAPGASWPKGGRPADEVIR